ncbi:MAG: YwaF family protein [Metamycoplasmataceae bacterium]
MLNKLPPIDYKSFFGKSFLSWQGNSATFQQSQWLFYLIIFCSIFSCFICFVYKTNVRNYYISNTKKINIIFSVAAYFVLFLYIFRTIILVVGGYPNLWEVIPLQFCRFFGLLMVFFFIFKKYHLIKYIAFFTILGAIAGLVIPDLGNSEYWTEYGGFENGYDSYIFWDFLIIHNYALLAPVSILIIFSPSYTKNEIFYSLITLLGFFIFIFCLDLGLSYINDRSWNANWFYVAPPHINGIDDLLKPYIGFFADWPFIWFTFSAIGLLSYFAILFIYLYVDGLEFVFTTIKNSQKKIIYIKSEKIEILKNSKIIKSS